MAIIARSIPGSTRKVSSKVRRPDGSWETTPGFKPGAKYNPRTDQGISQEDWNKNQAAAAKANEKFYDEQGNEKDYQMESQAQAPAQQPGVLGPGQFHTKEEAITAANSIENKELIAANIAMLDQKPNKQLIPALGDSGLAKTLDTLNPIKGQINLAYDTVSKLLTGQSVNFEDVIKKSAVNQAIMVGEAALATGAAWLATIGIGGSSAAAVTSKAAAKSAAYASAKAAGGEVLPFMKGIVGSTAGKTIMGISVPALVGVGGFATYSIAKDALTTDSQANWMMLDNAKGSIGMTLNDLYKSMGKMSPEERQKAIAAVDEAYALRDIANAKIEASARINPYTIAQKKAWSAATAATDGYINLLGEQIKNYDPLMDDWSIESQNAKNTKQLQTYGKPKYDEEGNPL